MDKIDIKFTTEGLINWIKEYFDAEGPKAKAIIGISGGKDSTVAAALCVKALGKDRVLGILMPEGVQNDIEDSYRVCKFLDIPYHEINIGSVVMELVREIPSEIFEVTPDNDLFYTNTPARIRMTTLYGVAALVGGRVINTSNASEIYVGYSTKWGDSVGDVSLFKNLTSEEVCAIGIELGLPEDLVYKAPSDGMSGKTDEDKLGFKYSEVNAIIRHSGNDICNYTEIQKRHRYSEHKRLPILAFKPIFVQEVSFEEITEEKSK